MTRLFPIMAVLAASLSSPALADLEPSPARVLAGHVAGQPRTCLSAFQRRGESRSYRSGDILYRNGGTWYLNHPRGCPQFRQDQAIVSQTPTGQLCSGDIVSLVDTTTGFGYGSCALGDFIPYTRARK